jgi:ornithine cyclodeaminase/alanine dehydrogenase-like protein (mu-crystallin family)
MPHDVIYLSDADVRSMLSMRAALKAVEQDFLRQAEPDGMVVGQPLAWSTDDRQLGFRWRLKTVVIRGVPVAGVRIAGYKVDETGFGSGGEREATRYIILSDPRSGSPLAIIDEHSSFGVRTAASLTIAAKHLATRDASVIGIIGVGNVGRAVLEGLAEVFPISDVRVMSLRPETRAAYVRDMRASLGLAIRACDTHEEVCRGADIVMCATIAKDPFLQWDWVKEGAFVGAVGAEEVTHEVYARCNGIYVDYDPRTEPHPEHIRRAIAAGAISEAGISGQLWEVVSGAKPGRLNDRERLLVCTVGLTSQDISIAHGLYEQAKAEGRGMRLPF